MDTTTPAAPQGGTLTIWYGDPDKLSTWRTVTVNAQPIPGRENEYTADNYHLNRPDGEYFDQTIVTDYFVDKDGVKHPYPKNIAFEADKGKETVGDIVVVLRKGPNGRWYVDVSMETVFISETESFEGLRLTRSSKSNVEQSLHDDPNLTILHKWSNPARLGGKPIACHFVKGNYAPQKVKAGTSIDVFEYGQKHNDLLGAGAFLNGLISMAYAEIAFEVLTQMRDPNRVSK